MTTRVLTAGGRENWRDRLRDGLSRIHPGDWKFGYE